ncbi:hypothetical protein AAE478_009190 [Parahypoxylon ruwenzoriense]
MGSEIRPLKPLSFLIPPTIEQTTHEIILVHGFNSNAKQPGQQAAKCQQVLESWVAHAADPIRDRVNVRTFAVDTADIFKAGPMSSVAITEAATELLTSIQATASNPVSPLRHPGVEPKGKDGRRKPLSSRFPPRSVIFIAHGIAAWVVKYLLVICDETDNWLDPAGLIFLDIPELLPSETPVDKQVDGKLADYVHKFANVFGVEISQSTLPVLVKKLQEIDAGFRELTGDRYGECEVAREDDSYNLLLWCGSIWMSSRPVFTLDNKAKTKTFFRRVGAMFASKKSSDDRLLEKLAHLQLRENLQEAIAQHVNYGLPHITRSPASMDLSAELSGGDGGGSSAEKGKGKEAMRLRSSRGTSCRLPLIPEHHEPQDEDNNNNNNNNNDSIFAALPVAPAPSSYPIVINDDNNNNNRTFDPSFYNTASAIAQRDAARDEASLASAQQRLEVILWHQQEHLGRSHPLTLSTQREVLATALGPGGRWNGRAADRRTVDDMREMEDAALRVWRRLDGALGRLHDDALAALATLLSARVPLYERGALDKDAVAEVQLLLEGCVAELQQQQHKLLSMLRLQFDVAAALARPGLPGDEMLLGLYRRTEGQLLQHEHEMDEGLLRELGLFATRLRSKMEERGLWWVFEEAGGEREREGERERARGNEVK